MGESQFLDYKLHLPDATDADKKEFLKDATALANTAGGVLVFGMETLRDENGQDTGIPKKLVGLGGVNLDKECLRFEAILRDGASPPITTQAGFRKVPLASGSSALLVGVARSVIAPHRVIFKGSSRFWRRSQSGNYEPGVPELRRMFLEQAEWLDDALLASRKRAHDVFERKVYPDIPDRPAVFVHLLPLGHRPETIDLRERDQQLSQAFPPLNHAGWNWRYNANGYQTFTPDGPACVSYTQILRNGGIEGYTCGFFYDDPARDIRYGFNGIHFLRHLKEFLTLTIKNVREVLGVEPPYALIISLLGTEGILIPSGTPGYGGRRIGVKELELPPRVVEDPSAFRFEELFPLLDIVWQSAGFSGVPRP